MVTLAWDGLAARALTAIRRDWTLEKILDLHAQGYETPVAGDVLHLPRRLKLTPEERDAREDAKEILYGMHYGMGKLDA